MATDATGTPTSLGIPKFNTSVDAPSGLGFNAAMDAIDVLIGNRIPKSIGTTVGDIIYWSGANTPARLGIGSTNQVLTVVGGIPAWSAAPGQSVWQFAPATIFSGAGYVANTLTAVLTQAIPGGTLGSAKRLRVLAFGDRLNNSGAGTTMRFQITYGGVTFYDEAATSNLGTSTNRHAWRLEFDLAANVDTGHQALSGRLGMDAGSTNPTTGYGNPNPGVDTVSAIFSSAGPLAVDSTTSQNLVLNVSGANSNANIDFKLQYALIEVVG